MLFLKSWERWKKGKKKIQWTDYIFQIMLTDNNNKNIHSATGMTPKEASEKKNEFKAMINVASKEKKEKISWTGCRW